MGNSEKLLNDSEKKNKDYIPGRSDSIVQCLRFTHGIPQNKIILICYFQMKITNRFNPPFRSCWLVQSKFRSKPKLKYRKWLAHYKFSLNVNLYGKQYYLVNVFFKEINTF